MPKKTLRLGFRLAQGEAEIYYTTGYLSSYLLRPEFCLI